jgi:Asp-tRNA(Asn)/Glu-tRNA(Gln) amidotransferase A subunit family amidase
MIMNERNSKRMLLDKRFHTSATVLESEPGARADDEGPVFGVKDLIAVQGVPRYLGFERCIGHKQPEATESATCVSLLRNHGYKLYATQKTPPLGLGLTDVDTVYPAMPGAYPGGSSTGSAVAVSTGITDVALGTDSMGSVRKPAALNDIWGFKPMHGSYPSDHIYDTSPSFTDVGTLARNLEDLEALDRILNADVESRNSARKPTKFKVLTIDNASMGPAINAQYQRALVVLSGDNDIRLESSAIDWEQLAYPADITATISNYELMRAIRQDETSGSWLRREINDYVSRYMDNPTVPASDYRQALQEKRNYAQHMEQRFPDIAVLTPALPQRPPSLPWSNRSDMLHRLTRYTSLANVLGTASICIPMHRSNSSFSYDFGLLLTSLTSTITHRQLFETARIISGAISAA